MAKKSTIAVMVAVQGQSPKVIKDLSASATVNVALKAAKLDTANLAGAVTVNGDTAELSQRLHNDDYIAVTPKVAGGR